MNNRGMGIIELIAVIGALGLIVGMFITKSIPIDAGAFVLALGLSIMAYIGIEMFLAWRSIAENEKKNNKKT